MKKHLGRLVDGLVILAMIFTAVMVVWFIAQASLAIFFVALVLLMAYGLGCTRNH